MQIPDAKLGREPPAYIGSVASRRPLFCTGHSKETAAYRMQPFVSCSNRRQASLRWLAAGALTAATLALAGCQSLTEGALDSAQVRFVDVSPGSPDMDLYVSGSGAAYNLGYGTVTSYVAVSPGASTISANRANTLQPLASVRATLNGSRQYTAVVSNSLGSLDETLYPDRSTPAPAGMIAVRVLNEATRGGPLDVYLVPGTGALATTAPVARDLGYSASSGYIELPASGSYSIMALPAGTASGPAASSLLSDVSLRASSRSVRTVVITDAPAGDKGLSSFVLEDLDMP